MLALGLPVFILFYLALAGMHWISLGSPLQMPLTLSCLVTSLVGVALWRIRPKGEPGLIIIHFLILLLILLNSLAHVWLSMDAKQSTNLMVVLILGALTVHHRSVFYSSLALTWLGWTACVTFSHLTGLGAAEPWGHFTFTLAFCSLGAMLGFRMRFLRMQQDMQTHVSMKQNLDALKTEIRNREQAEHKLQQQNVQLDWMANHDPLTGLANRRKFNDTLADAMLSESPVCLLVIDLDYFKNLNDSLGHPAGDQALQQCADYMQAAARKFNGLAARIGGEEFALVLPGVEMKQGKLAYAELRDRIGNANISHPNSPISRVVTFSAGLVMATKDDECSDSRLLSQADSALYIAKQQGRNRLIHWCVSDLVNASNDPTGARAQTVS